MKGQQSENYLLKDNNLVSRVFLLKVHRHLLIWARNKHTSRIPVSFTWGYHWTPICFTSNQLIPNRLFSEQLEEKSQTFISVILSLSCPHLLHSLDFLFRMFTVFLIYTLHTTWPANFILTSAVYKLKSSSLCNKFPSLQVRGPSWQYITLQFLTLTSWHSNCLKLELITYYRPSIKQFKNYSFTTYWQWEDVVDHSCLQITELPQGIITFKVHHQTFYYIFQGIKMLNIIAQLFPFHYHVGLRICNL